MNERTNFFCLCMSPAIDGTVQLKTAPANGAIMKDVEETETVGGKGLNVARWLALRGERVACGGLLGADNAVPFEREMARHGIRDAFLRVPGSTRKNEMIVWPGGSVKLNRKAFPGLTASDWSLDALLAPFTDAGSVCILSGSLPPTVPADFYAQAIRALKARGIRTVLDTSGAPLVTALREAGAECRPDLIKPNADECEPLVGFVPKTPDEFRRATEMLRVFCGFPIISDGAAGCWFNGTFVAAPQVAALDTTAAGDTLLAEFCHRYFSRNRDDCAPDLPNAARWAVAAGSASVTCPGAQPPPFDLVETLASSL